MMVIDIRWGCCRPVVHVVIVEMVVWGVSVVDVRPVDGSCYVVAVLHVVTALMVVHEELQCWTH